MTLYDIVADLRREHPTAAATETLDLVVTELGRTRDNLKSALQALSSKPLPSGGKPILDELSERAHAAGIDDLDYGPDPFGKPPFEPLDEATAGIGIVFALSSLVAVGLAAAAVVAGVIAIFNASG
ncbi:MAG TPA: hypothetical protein VGV88_09915 [Candidatus Dormibacteraeota bacterium]|nr:hypothetical protein [Candidatus Dormibacteraeota bacterium]